MSDDGLPAPAESVDTATLLQQFEKAHQRLTASTGDAAPYEPNTLVVTDVAITALRRLVEEATDRPVYDWPRRGFTADQVADVLGFVARGGFDSGSLVRRICSTFTESARRAAAAHYGGWWGPLASSIAERTIRRAKRERRIAWDPHAQCYVALPSWQHKPIHDRRGWLWPKSRLE
jgi:hypothetical protein